MRNLKRLWAEQQVRMKLKAEGLDPLYENFTEPDDGKGSFYGTEWRAQSFTVGAVGHTITSVKLKLCRADSPGTITVSIRNTDGLGYPTGDDLTSGTTDGNTLPHCYVPPAEWREISLTEITLNPTTKYAIVARAPSVAYANRIEWSISSAGGYDGGNSMTSSSSGVDDTWSGYTTDGLFEVWGNPLGWTGKISGVTDPAKVMGVDVANIASVKGVS